MGSLNYLTGNMIPLFQIENLACLAQETPTEVLRDLTHGLIAEHRNLESKIQGEDKKLSELVKKCFLRMV